MRPLLALFIFLSYFQLSAAFYPLDLEVGRVAKKKTKPIETPPNTLIIPSGHESCYH
jgi:hypothetical protein